MRKYGVAGIFFLSLAGCSFQSALDAMVSPVRQQELVSIASRLCRSPRDVLQLMEPSVARDSAAIIDQVGGECVGSDAPYRLTTYRFNTNTDLNGPTTRQEYALVVAGDDDGPWAQVEISFSSQNDGPMLITAWHVAKTTERPMALSYIDNWDGAVGWIRIAAIIVPLLLGGLIVFLVRRSRRKRASDELAL